MKLVIKMQLLADDNETVVAEEKAHIRNVNDLSTLESLGMLKQWIGEKFVSLRVQAIQSPEVPWKSK